MIIGIGKYAPKLVRGLHFRRSDASTFSRAIITAIVVTGLSTELTLEDCKFVGFDRALSLQRVTTKLVLKQLEFIRNVAPSNNGDDLGGGAILIDSCSDISLSRSKFVSNKAPSSSDGKAMDGGAMAIYSTTSSSTVSMTDCWTESNVATGRGGAVFVGRTSSFFMSSTKMNHDAANEGGALAAFAATIVV